MQRRQKQIQPTDLKMRAIGAVVREFRGRAGHSQERLSGECGFDRTYISRVERGIINPTVGRLWQIADALETYGVKNWGKGYFAINKHGHVTVQPNKRPPPARRF